MNITMKKYKYGMIGLGMLALSACIDTLNTHPKETYDEKLVWGSKATAEAFINSTYESVITGMGYGGGGSCVSWEARTPNSAQCSQVGEDIDNVATETGLGTGNNWGPNRFSLLRSTNLILDKVAASTTLTEGERTELMAHGYFLRGLVFFGQARMIGRFVPVKQVFAEKDTVAVKLPMTKNLVESYEHVIADLEKAYAGLPTRNRAGLPTKWAAGVILSRAALQAYAYTNNKAYVDRAIVVAKEVIDNSGISLSTSTGMFNEMDDQNAEILWAYYRLQANTTIGGYAELIRTYPNISGDDVKNSLSPVSLNNRNGRTFEGWAIHFPTQDLVDQYLVTDEATGKALPWYETSQYKNNVIELDPNTVTTEGQVDAYKQTNGGDRRIPSPQDLRQKKEGYPLFARYAKLKDGVTDRDLSDIMYKGRDRRFAVSVVYDKARWIGETVETNLGGNLSAGVRDREDGGWYNTVTGYYWRKSNIENPDPRAYFDCKVALHYNLARLGEAYMNLAEAYLLKGDVANAVAALNATRTTHGGLAPSTATTPAEAWRDYIRERRVEMANEGGDIYFSYLRWGKYGGHANYGRPAGDIIYDLDRPVYKMSISRDRKQILVGQLTLLNSANRNFTVRRYLLPIHQGFLDTRAAYNLDHEQNEGW